MPLLLLRKGGVVQLLKGGEMGPPMRLPPRVGVWEVWRERWTLMRTAPPEV